MNTVIVTGIAIILFIVGILCLMHQTTVSRKKKIKIACLFEIIQDSYNAMFEDIQADSFAKGQQCIKQFKIQDYKKYPNISKMLIEMNAAIYIVNDLCYNRNNSVQIGNMRYTYDILKKENVFHYESEEYRFPKDKDLYSCYLHIIKETKSSEKKPELSSAAL